MIIYTTPEIAKLNPKRISTIVTYAGSDSCIAEVPDDFDIDVPEMEDFGIAFWYEVAPGTMGTDDWEPDWKSKGGFLEMMDNCYLLTKIHTQAMALAVIANHEGKDPFDIWEGCIKKPKYLKPMKHQRRGWIIVNIGHPNKKDDFISGSSFRRLKKTCIGDYIKTTNHTWREFNNMGFRCVEAVIMIKTKNS